MINKIPALEGKSSSELIGHHLNAMHTVHKLFIEAKSHKNLQGLSKLKLQIVQDISINQVIQFILKENIQIHGRVQGQVSALKTNTF